MTIPVYDINNFKASVSIPKRVYCSNDLTYGVRLFITDIALKHKYIQVNTDKVIKFMVIDIDHDDPLIFEKVGLPCPNFVVKDRQKNTSHFIYALSCPIYLEYLENFKPLNLFAKIQQEYTRLLKGDPLYVGRIAKNPLHEHWFTWNANHFRPYELYELADYITLPQKILKREAIGEGRNCYLFDTVRKWSYEEVLFYKANQATQEDFYNVVLDRLEKLNVFEKSLPLEFNEIKSIAKSISKWTWSNFSVEKFSEIQTKRSHKRKSIRNKNIRLGQYE